MVPLDLYCSNRVQIFWRSLYNCITHKLAKLSQLLGSWYLVHPIIAYMLKLKKVTFIYWNLVKIIIDCIWALHLVGCAILIKKKNIIQTNYFASYFQNIVYDTNSGIRIQRRHITSQNTSASCRSKPLWWITNACPRSGYLIIHFSIPTSLARSDRSIYKNYSF